jgi:protein-S-isoprenylcysteine O-methyltransferase Ste14
MSRSPKYWPLVTFAAVFVLLGVAGLVLSDDLAEPTRRGVPIGFVYGAMIVAGLGLIGVAAWSRHRTKGGLSHEERQQAEDNRKHHMAMARYYLWAAGAGTVLLALVGVLALLDA